MTPVLIVEGNNSNMTMEVIWHLPPWSWESMSIKIIAKRHLLIDMTDSELDDLLYFAHKDRKEYRRVLNQILDDNPNTFIPQ